MNRLRSILMLASVFTLSACNDHAPNEQSHSSQDDATEYVSTITESQTGAQLTVVLDQTELDLTDVMKVHVTMRWTDGVTLELIEPDWETAGWIGSTKSARGLKFDGSAYQQQIDYTLEPFLSGDYQIPSFGIRVQSQAAGKRIARLQPVDIVVSSVLEASDSSELDPAIGFAQLTDDATESNHMLGVWIGLGVAFFSAGIVLILHTKTHTHPEHIDPEAVLTVASAAPHLSEEDLGALHQALIELGKEHDGINPIAHEIERARFSGSLIDHQRIQSAATRALEICGVNQ